MGKINRVWLVIASAIAVGLVGFMVWLLNREKGTLLIEGNTEMVEKAFPPNHPYQNTQGQNEVIKVLQAGERIEYTDKKLDKDFAVYEVRVDGRRGYIVLGGPFKEQR